MLYDLIVVGSGPGGYVSAIRAAQLGGRVALVEAGDLGGTCLNRGCIPTKTLLASVERVNMMNELEQFGVCVTDYAVNWSRIIKRKDAVVADLKQGVEQLLKRHQIEVVKGNGSIDSPGKLAVTDNAGDTRILEARNIVIATGSVPLKDMVTGYNTPGVIDSDAALTLREVPRKLLILGGGVIGCEFATIFQGLGSQVTIVEAMPTILPMLDRELGRRMLAVLKRRGIEIKTQSKIEIIEGDGNILSAVLSGGERISADKVLIAIGRRPNSGELKLEKVGVKLGHRGEVLVNDRMETSVTGIYAVGDVTGKIPLAHVASAQGIVAAENAMGKYRTMNYEAIPQCVFTRPEMACVGLTEQEANQQGIEIRVGKFPFTANGKARCMGEADGQVKVIADATSDRVLGVHIIGPHASDLIAAGALAVRMGVKAQEWAATIHAHPTLSESIMEAAAAVRGMAIHA